MAANPFFRTTELLGFQRQLAGHADANRHQMPMCCILSLFLPLLSLRLLFFFWKQLFSDHHRQRDYLLFFFPPLQGSVFFIPVCLCIPAFSPPFLTLLEYFYPKEVQESSRRIVGFFIFSLRSILCRVSLFNT